MVDTVRSESDLLTTLFQDGQTHGISANDIRDLIVSITGGAFAHTGRETFVRMDTAQVPQMFTVEAAQTGLDDTATMSATEQIARILECTPTAVATYTTRTGTQIEAALPASVANGDGFYQTIINLGGSGDTISLDGGAGVTIVGNSAIDGPGDGVISSGTFFYRRSAANTFIVYRVA